ncbi:MAG: glycosyltransferase family 4 protein [Thermoleophilaceae bacterium]
MRVASLCGDIGVRIPGEKGASLHLEAITTALARMGHDVMLIGVAGHGPPPAGVRPLLLPHPGRTEGLVRELRKIDFAEHLVAAAREPLGDFAPEVVYERLSLFGTAGHRLARATGALHVLEVNSLPAQEERRWRGLRLENLARQRQDRVLRSADLRVAVSDELAVELRRLAPWGATHVLPNGVDAEAFRHLPRRREARTQFDLPRDAHLLGFVGSLRPWHGVELAIEALGAIPDGVLVVAGDGPVRGWLEGLARDRGVAERVRWLGQVPHDRIPALLAALDIALLPYPALDGFSFSPLKLYEYLAAGVPVIASDIGQVRPLLEGGRLGQLVAPGDPAALALALERTLLDPAAARSVAAKAREAVLDDHSWDRRAQQLTTLFGGTRAHALAA